MCVCLFVSVGELVVVVRFLVFFKALRVSVLEGNCKGVQLRMPSTLVLSHSVGHGQAAVAAQSLSHKF